MKKVMLLLLSALLISLSIVSCGKSGPSASLDKSELNGKAGQAFADTDVVTVKLERTSVKTKIAKGTSLMDWLDETSKAALGKLNSTTDNNKVVLVAAADAAAGAIEIKVELAGIPTVATKDGEPVKIALAIKKEQLDNDAPSDDLKAGEISIAVEPNAKIIDKSDTKVGIAGADAEHTQALEFTMEYSLGTAKFKATQPNSALAGKAAAKIKTAGDDIGAWFGLKETDDVKATATEDILEGDSSFTATFTLSAANVVKWATTASSNYQDLTLTITAAELDNNGDRGISIPNAAKVYVYKPESGKTAAIKVSNATVTGNAFAQLKDGDSDYFLSLTLENDVFAEYLDNMVANPDYEEGGDEPEEIELDVSAFLLNLPAGLTATLAEPVDAASTVMKVRISGAPEAANAAAGDKITGFVPAYMLVATGDPTAPFAVGARILASGGTATASGTEEDARRYLALAAAELSRPELAKYTSVAENANALWKIGAGAKWLGGISVSIGSALDQTVSLKIAGDDLVKETFDAAGENGVPLADLVSAIESASGTPTEKWLDITAKLGDADSDTKYRTLQVTFKTKTDKIVPEGFGTAAQLLHGMMPSVISLMGQTYQVKIPGKVTVGATTLNITRSTNDVSVYNPDECKLGVKLSFATSGAKLGANVTDHAAQRKVNSDHVTKVEVKPSDAEGVDFEIEITVDAAVEFEDDDDDTNWKWDTGYGAKQGTEPKSVRLGIGIRPDEAIDDITKVK